MLYTVPAREIQRKYKKVLEEANKIGKPIVVIAHNKPIGAVIGLELLEKIQLELAVREALEQYKRGETIPIEDFETFAQKVRKASK